MLPLAMIVTRTLPVPSVLAAVLAGDGITLPGHDGAEHAIACFNPHHRDDAAKAMRIDTVRGVYRCYGCGIHGNSWTYLTRIRGLQPQAAEALLAELGWPEELVLLSHDWHQEQERVKSGAAKYMDEPCMTVGGRNGVPLARAIAQHVYRLADRRLVCVRFRYEAIHRRIPKCLTFTPSHRGGWWEALPNSTSVPAEDRHAGELPLYRLPELLEAIAGNDREIWVVADEKCVDAVLALPDTDFSKDGKVPVTCLFGDYRGKPGQCDLAPLRGRRCLLIADTDTRDRNAVLATAKALAKLDCGIRLCLPDGEGGYGVAVAIAEGGYRNMIDWIRKAGIRWFRRGPTVPAVAAYLEDLPDGQWAVEPADRTTGWMPRCPSARDYRNIIGLRGWRSAQTGALGVLSVSLPCARTSPDPGTACASPAGIPSPSRRRSRGSKQQCDDPGVSRRRRQRRRERLGSRQTEAKMADSDWSLEARVIGVGDFSSDLRHELITLTAFI